MPIPSFNDTVAQLGLLVQTAFSDPPALASGFVLDTDGQAGMLAGAA
jgi:hypothetical protein